MAQDPRVQGSKCVRSEKYVYFNFLFKAVSHKLERLLVVEEVFAMQVWGMECGSPALT